MIKVFLAIGALAVISWLFVDGTLPEPTSRSRDPKVATIPAVSSTYAFAARNVLEARDAPVPFIRNVRPSPAVATSPEVPNPDSEEQAQDELEKSAAKAAVEADGYKRASVLGKGSDGTWRAKAYRGATEVRLTVDGTGRVSLE